MGIMAVVKCAEILALPLDGRPIPVQGVAGIIDRLYPANRKGRNTWQNGSIRDDTGEIEIMFSMLPDDRYLNRDEDRGRAVVIEATKPGDLLWKRQEYNGRVFGKLEISKNAIVRFVDQATAPSPSAFLSQAQGNSPWPPAAIPAPGPSQTPNPMGAFTPQAGFPPPPQGGIPQPYSPYQKTNGNNGWNGSVGQGGGQFAGKDGFVPSSGNVTQESYGFVPQPQASPKKVAMPDTTPEDLQQYMEGVEICFRIARVKAQEIWIAAKKGKSPPDWLVQEVFRALTAAGWPRRVRKEWFDQESQPEKQEQEVSEEQTALAL